MSYVNELEIRLLREQDLDALSELESLTFEDPWSKASLQNELRNSMARYWGVFFEERLIAYIGYWLILDEAHITNLAVNPGFRGQGVGEMLARFALNACRLKKILSVTLEVRRSNTVAQKLYQKLGFVSYGERPHYYNNGESAVIMWADISEGSEDGKDPR